MKKLALASLVVGAMFVMGKSAGADDWGHDRFHDDLEHREFHRYLIHRDAHRYPMTWRQHDRLHDSLDHDRYHDGLEHRAGHSGSPYVQHGYVAPRSHSGFGIQGRNFSLWIGH